MAISRPLRRFGPGTDGGYLMPDDLDGVSASISPGVSTEVGFDLEIADRGIDVHLADASVLGPPMQHERFHFTKKFLDTYNSDTTITLDDYCKAIGGSDDLILQMDIEGAEYRVLGSASDEILSRFRMMVIEFHDLDCLFSRDGFPTINSIFRRLLRTHYVVHIHPCNFTVTSIKAGGLEIPPVMEFTFYRKDRDRFEARELQFPHPLDVDCHPANPTLVLPKCWRRYSEPTGKRTSAG